MTTDDEAGLLEVLKETQPDGFGLKVNAKYYMQIFNTVKGRSKQREQQVRIDKPLQYFFAFDHSTNYTNEEWSHQKYKSDIYQSFKGNQLQKSIVTQTFPL